MHDIIATGTCVLKMSLNPKSIHPGGTAAAVPPPFRPGNPALCGSRPLVTHITVD